MVYTVVGGHAKVGIPFYNSMEMDNDKIENNPSYQKLKRELQGAEAFLKVSEFCSFLGFENEELNEAFSSLPEMKKQLELLSKSPDKFNEHFSKSGWIAHESMNSDLMLTSIELAEKGHFEIAEQELIEYYSSNKMQWLVHQLRGVEAFSIRYNLFLLAYEDTLAERYHSVVPNLLMMIDGAVNDIDREKGFFAENTNLTAWDSIAAHSTGLTALKSIFSDSRKKTTTEKILLPYRHGILHGRDLGFANKTVTAKCWAAVFAIKDWAHALKQGKGNPPKPEPKLSLTQSLIQLKQSINDYSESKKKNEIVSNKVKEWKPRQLTVGVDLPDNGNSSDYESFTPEQAAVEFIELWNKKNFGGIAQRIHQFSKAPISLKKEAGKVRKVFEGKSVKDYRLVKVVDCSPAISEITLAISILFEGELYNRDITLRLIYEGNNNEILIFGDRGGQWKFIEKTVSRKVCK